MKMLISLALLLAVAQAPDKPAGSPAPAETSCTPYPSPPAAHQRRIADLLASTTGAAAETAFHVRSIREEYEILGALGLCPQMQALIFRGDHPYDMLSTLDPRTGAARELWFDISSFYGHEF